MISESVLRGMLFFDVLCMKCSIMNMLMIHQQEVFMSTVEKVKLKWFRLIQIVILPIMILSGIYMLISYFTDLFGLNLSWTDHSLREMIEFGGADVFHLGSFFWPVIAMIAQRILTLVLALYAWIGSFRFRKYSVRCWLGLNVIDFLAVCALIWAVWEFGLNRGGIIQMAQYISAQTGRTINVSSSMITALKIVLILMGVIVLLYTIANFIYFRKRRHLFTESDDYQEPYEEDEDEDISQPAVPVAEKQQTVTEVKPAEPEPAVQPEEDTQPVLEPVIVNEPEPVSEAEVKEETEPQPVQEETYEPDPLEMLLKDTEESMNQLSARKDEPEEVQMVQNDPEPAVTEEQPEVTPVNAEPQPEPEPAVQEPESESEPVLQEPEPEPVQEEKPAGVISVLRSNPLAYDEVEEDSSLAATQILEPVDETKVKKQNINFCPDCGKRIPDPQMRYCIYCGRKIR